MDVKLEKVAGKEYIAAKPGTKLWVVYKQWPTNKIDRVAAYFTESLARAHAGELVGKDQALIGLETIDVKDKP
jgi:hypothetical protein